MLLKLMRILFSRTFIFGLMILVQLTMLVWLLIGLSQLATAAYVGLTLISALIVLWLFQGSMNPAYKMVWALIMMLFPLVGGAFFIFWNRIKLGGGRRELLTQVAAESISMAVQDPQVLERLAEQDADSRCLAQYIESNAWLPVVENTAARYYAVGEHWFADLLEDLESAREFIFLEYFIIQPGEMFNAVLEVLERKAKAGVDVRLMYDDMGTLLLLPEGFLKQLRKRGIQAELFNPLLPRLDGFLNSRDHRKICVIDGRIAYNGGLNIADEYINKKRVHGHWKDTAVRLEGEAVWPFTLMFLQMWRFSTGNNVDYLRYRKSGKAQSDGYVQPFSSNPLDNRNVCENVYLSIISRAKRYVYITTPYLICDNEMVTALCLAAKSGVDVRIITPGVADKWYVHYVTQSYYGELLEAGVKIHEYTPGFMHAKMFVCDDRWAVVGTANLDFRSLYLHFECGTLFYFGSMVKRVYNDIAGILQSCRLVLPEDVLHVPAPKRIVQSLLRVWAPLM